MFDNIINILQAIHKTIGTIKTDNENGNWNKLLGCRQACEQAIQALKDIEAKPSDDEPKDGDVHDD